MRPRGDPELGDTRTGVVNSGNAPHNSQHHFPYTPASFSDLVYEVKDLGEDVGTFSRVDGRLIKDTGLKGSSRERYLLA